MSLPSAFVQPDSERFLVLRPLGGLHDHARTAHDRGSQLDPVGQDFRGPQHRQSRALQECRAVGQQFREQLVVEVKTGWGSLVEERLEWRPGARRPPEGAQQIGLGVITEAGHDGCWRVVEIGGIDDQA